MDKFEKYGLGAGVGIIGTLGVLGWQAYAASAIWHEHNAKITSGGTGKPHKHIMPTIIIVSVMLLLASSSIIARTLYGFIKIGPTRLISCGILIGLLILNLWLRSRYTGELVRLDDDTARCPGGTTMKKTAANNCTLSLSNCPDVKECEEKTGEAKRACKAKLTKMKSVWNWWEIPTLSIGGSIALAGWIVYTVITVKNKGKNL